MVTFKFKILGWFSFLCSEVEMEQEKWNLSETRYIVGLKNFYNIMNGIKLVLFVYNFARICLQSKISRQQFSSVFMFRCNRSLKNPIMEQVSFQSYCRRNTLRFTERHFPITKSNEQLRVPRCLEPYSPSGRLFQFLIRFILTETKQQREKLSEKRSACGGILHGWFSHLLSFLLLYSYCFLVSCRLGHQQCCVKAPITDLREVYAYIKQLIKNVRIAI